MPAQRRSLPRPLPVRADRGRSHAGERGSWGSRGHSIPPSNRSWTCSGSTADRIAVDPRGLPGRSRGPMRPSCVGSGGGRCASSCRGCPSTSAASKDTLDARRRRLPPEVQRAAELGRSWFFMGSDPGAPEDASPRRRHLGSGEAPGGGGPRPEDRSRPPSPFGQTRGAGAGRRAHRGSARGPVPSRVAAVVVWAPSGTDADALTQGLRLNGRGPRRPRGVCATGGGDPRGQTSGGSGRWSGADAPDRQRRPRRLRDIRPSWEPLAEGRPRRPLQGQPSAPERSRAVSL